MPKSWEEFEEIVADIAVFLWNDKYIVRNGRKGQAQDGVDIYGNPVQGEYAGIQCKNKTITIQEINNAITKAEKFEPPLKEFILAVGSQTDSKLQEEIRKISDQRVKDGKYPVKIFFWEDICLRLTDKPELIEKHFTDFVQRPSSVSAIYEKIRNSTPDGWLYDDQQGIYTYKKDSHLMIRRVEEEKVPLNVPWLEKFASQRPSEDL